MNFEHYSPTIQQFANNAWKKIQPRVKKTTNWFHCINLTDLVTSKNADKFRQSLVEIASVKDDKNENNFELFIATQLKDKKKTLEEATKLMNKMFPNDGVVMKFDRNEGYLMLFHVKLANKYKFIAGALFRSIQL